MPKKPRKFYRAYKAPEFAPWKPKPPHEHTLITVHRRDGEKEIITDMCIAKGCHYEQARDIQ